VTLANLSEIDARRLERLCTELSSWPDCVCVDSLTQAIRKASREKIPILFAPQKPLVIAQQFQVHPDLVVVDEVTGSLGLVTVLPHDMSADEAEKTIERRIDEAAYARNLFLNHKSANDRVPWTLEVVFVTDLKHRTGVTQAFRGIATRTDYLYAIGINRLEWTADWDSDDASTTSLRPAMRRAFAFLMTGIRKWYRDVLAEEKHKERESSKRKASRRLTEIRLRDYRLPGDRSLTIEGADKDRDVIQLVYGHNGSGKSSFVEALEYVVTGGIVRLGELITHDQFRETIVNKDVLKTDEDASATVELFVSGRKSPLKFPVRKKSCERPLGDHVNAQSFRLDLAAMDRLLLSSPAERTEIFMQAFFSREEIELRKSVPRARQAVHVVWESVPERLREALRPADRPMPALDQVRARLGWLRSESGTPDPKIGMACLPLSLVDLHQLATAGSKLGQLLEKLQRMDIASLAGPEAEPRSPVDIREFPNWLSSLEGVLTRMAAGAANRRGQLEHAISALELLTGWHVSDTPLPTGHNIVSDLNQWLDASATADLVDQHLQLVQIIRAVESTGQSFPGMEPVGLFKKNLGSRTEQHLKDWRDRTRELANEAQKRLPQTQLTGDIATADVDPSRSSVPHPMLTSQQIRALDQVSSDLAPGDRAQALKDSLPLGQRVQDVINSQQIDSEFRIGEPGWADTLIEQLKKRHAAVDHLVREFTSDRRSTVPLLESVLDAFEELGREQSRMQSTFLAMMGMPVGASAEAPVAEFDLSAKGVAGSGVYDALNEMTALFTPARWAYEDVIVRIENEQQASLESEGQVAWRTMDGKRADLRLNTAQLNTVILAMFLLMARRVPNPLKLLILDDPFQNMDELTVSAVARGMSRLARVWNHDTDDAWTILLFLHGEETLQRLRHEMATTIHMLPFQVPSGSKTALPKKVPERLKQGVQTRLASLTTLLTEE